MIKVIGVRFRKAGKVYYFDPAQMEIKMGDHVIVETARGIEFGEVVLGVREVDEKKVIQPLKSVIRMATKNDEELERKNKEKEHEAFQICQEKIRKHELQMKLIDAEYTFDNNKLLFYFTADGRIDFRELVKDLSALLSFIFIGVYSGFNQDGKRAESVLKSDEDFGCVRSSDVLPEIRGRDV